MTSIAQKRKEVEQAVQAVFEVVEKDEHRTAQAVERAVWVCLLALGRAVMAWFFARSAARSEAEVSVPARLVHGGSSHTGRGRCGERGAAVVAGRRGRRAVEAGGVRKEGFEGGRGASQKGSSSSGSASSWCRSTAPSDQS